MVYKNQNQAYGYALGVTATMILQAYMERFAPQINAFESFNSTAHNQPFNFTEICLNDFNGTINGTDTCLICGTFPFIHCYLRNNTMVCDDRPMDRTSSASSLQSVLGLVVSSVVYTLLF